MGRKSKERDRYKDREIKEKHTVRFMVYFQNNGVENFSMSKMAKDLRISKTTIYNHFTSKEEIIDAAITYKLNIISEYQSVLENITLTYTERYRKAMLFFCVQIFDVSNKLLLQIKESYPKIWRKVAVFQKNVMLDLKSYYEIGIEIGVFKPDTNPLLLSLDDQKFFDLLSNQNVLKENNIEVLEAFNHHYSVKFNGLLDPSYEILNQLPKQ